VREERVPLVDLPQRHHPIDRPERRDAAHHEHEGGSCPCEFDRAGDGVSRECGAAQQDADHDQLPGLDADIEQQQGRGQLVSRQPDASGRVFLLPGGIRIRIFGSRRISGQ
jgi:hypothetical protein